MVINTLYDLLQVGLKQYPNNPAYAMFGGEELTFAEVGERVEAVKASLVASGLSAGDRAVILSNNMPNWCVSYFAVVSSGMVAVPLLPDFSNDELDMLIKHSEAKALFVSDRLYSRLNKETLASLNVVIRTKNLGVISQSVNTPGELGVPKPEDLAVIIYTSGTTSSPKGVMLTHHALAKQVEILCDLYPITPEDSFLSVLPLSHTYESSLGMLFPMANGVKTTYLDKPPTASTLLPALRSVRPTLMLIVPLIIEKIFRSQVLAKFTSNAFWRTLHNVGFTRRYLYKIAGKKLHKVFGSRLRFLGIGGAKLDAQAERFLYESKFPYAIGYGLTETAPILAGAIPCNVLPGSTGFAVKDVKLRLDNINPETGYGELVALTPCALSGYYKNEEATKATFTEDGWFRTGDLAEIAADGRISIKGRLKNMILGPSGENIYPEEIESVLNSHVVIADSLVTEQEGRLVALVNFDTAQLEAKFEELREEFDTQYELFERKKEELMREIREYVNSKVNRFSRLAEVVEEKEEFVKTPTQKIKRFLYSGGNRPSAEERAKSKESQKSEE
ncbi:MAG: AMP-binding protein [Rikenellaceae bacterium]